MIRVYVRGGLQDVPGVVGTVTAQRRRYGVWVDSGALTPIAPASVTAFHDAPYASERGSSWGSLNFLIPGDAMHGEMRLKVHVEQSGHDDIAADASEVVYATLRRRGDG